MKLGEHYPTIEHGAAARAIVEFWSSSYPVDAVLLVNSCARGRATRNSCLDLTVLVPSSTGSEQLAHWENEWERFNEANREIAALAGVGQYSVVHLNLINGVFEPTEQDEAAGPDDFELALGNTLAYSVALWERNGRLDGLKRKWLPYYPESLRAKRLERVRFFCLNNLNHIPLFVERGLNFQAFDRLYNAHQEFLQALFIQRRIYPIAYNKWIHEQLVEMLGLPELYGQLNKLFEINRFEGREFVEKARVLEKLLEQYAPSLGKMRSG